MELPQGNLLILLSMFLHSVRCQVTVEQNPLELSRTEGQNSTISCQYKTANFYSLHWYKQYAGERPTFLLLLFGKEAGKDRGPNFHAEHNPEKQMSDLHIRGVQLQDAATYFCAVYTDARKIIFGKGTLLKVNPNITESEPSVYELEPADKNKQLSACLFTDYFPDEIKVSSDGSEPVKRNSSVVVVEDEASYGTVLWQESRDDFQCAAVYQEQKYLVLAKNGTADVCSETQMRFETDERLNLLSLTVLGLRVIFFKSVALNLLLTFRLWSH